MLFVDAAREERLQHVAPQRLLGLLGNGESCLHIIAIIGELMSRTKALHRVCFSSADHSPMILWNSA